MWPSFSFSMSVLPEPAIPISIVAILFSMSMSMKNLILIVSPLWTRHTLRGISGSSSNFGTFSSQEVNSWFAGSTNTSKTVQPIGNSKFLNSFRNHLENSLL